MVKTGKMMPLLRRMPYLRRTEFALPIFAVVLAVATMVAYGPEKADFGDATDYAGVAVSLLNDGSYPRQSSLPFFRAPLYPLLIAAIWRVVRLASCDVSRASNSSVVSAWICAVVSPVSWRVVSART